MKRHELRSDRQRLVDLGSASKLTKGNDGDYNDMGGKRATPGLLG